jgi:antitoxin HicB
MVVRRRTRAVPTSRGELQYVLEAATCLRSPTRRRVYRHVPLLPELITEGDTVADAIENVRDALAAVLELYQEQGNPLPERLTPADPAEPVRVEMVVAVP